MVSAIAIFRQLPIGALFEPRATIPSCSISAIRKQVAAGSSILRGGLLQYSLSGGCCDSMCCSARRHARDNEISRYTGARVLSVIGILRQLRPCGLPVKSSCEGVKGLLFFGRGKFGTYRKEFREEQAAQTWSS